MKLSKWLVGGALLALAPSVTPIFAQASKPGQSWIVAVGVDDYLLPAVPDLRYANADAKLLTQAFVDLAKVPASNTFVMTSDSLIEDSLPRATNIAYRLGWLKDKCKPEDSLLFYFAGHGAQIGNESYLMTEEADNRSIDTLKASSLRAGALTEHLKSIPARRILVVLDCCRNDPSGKGESRAQNLLQEFSVGGSKDDYATLFACQVGERSWEWKEKQHGFFTYHFAEGLRQGAVEADGRVTLVSLNNYLKKTVNDSAQKYVKSSQTPQILYQGALTDWTLVRTTAPKGNPGKAMAAGEQAKLVAELDAARARLDQSEALRKQAEDKLVLEESRRKKLESDLAILEKKVSRLPEPAGDGLVAARDQALSQLDKANQAMDKARSSSVDMEILQTEKEQLLAENQALQARIKVLELKLGKSNLSASRDLTIQQDPNAQKLRERASRAEAQAPGSQDALKQSIAALQYESTLWSQRLQLVERESRETIASILAQHPDLKPEIEKLQIQLEVYQRSIEALEAHIKMAAAAAQESDVRLRQALARAEQAEAELAQVKSTMGAKIEKLKQENHQLTQEVADLKRSAEASMARLESTQDQARKSGVAFDKRTNPAGTTRRVRWKDILHSGPSTEDPANELPAQPQ